MSIHHLPAAGRDSLFFSSARVRRSNPVSVPLLKLTVVFTSSETMLCHPVLSRRCGGSRCKTSFGDGHIRVNERPYGAMVDQGISTVCLALASPSEYRKGTQDQSQTTSWRLMPLRRHRSGISRGMDSSLPCLTRLGALPLSPYAQNTSAPSSNQTLLVCIRDRAILRPYASSH